VTVAYHNVVMPSRVVRVAYHVPRRPSGTAAKAEASMTWKTFFSLSAIYFVLCGSMWYVFDAQYVERAIPKGQDKIPGWHYAVDTMTLRGRIADPVDSCLKNPPFFKFWEDLSSLAVFILFGFGVAFSISTLEDLWLIKRFQSEPPDSHRFQTFQQWVEQRHPESYERLFPRKGKTSPPLRLWLSIKRWLLNVKAADAAEGDDTGAPMAT
jgi:hypothetical protein